MKSSISQLLSRSPVPDESQLPFKEMPPDVHLYFGANKSTFVTDLRRLRYEVLCEIQNVKPMKDWSIDFVDHPVESRNVHIIACANNAVIGGVSIIPITEWNQFFQHRKPDIDSLTDLPPMAQSIEIGGLVIAKHLRRRQNDSMEGITVNAYDRTPLPNRSGQYSRNQILLLSLFRMIYRYCRLNGIRYWFMKMDSSLYLTLKNFGLHFLPIEPVQPCDRSSNFYVADLKNLNACISEKDALLWKWFLYGSINTW